MSTKALNWFPAARHRACVAAVAKAFGLTAQDLLGGRRVRHIAHARHAAYWVARHRFGLSWPQTARVLARDDHSTALHCARVAEMLRDRDPAYRARTDWLLNAPLDDALPLDAWTRGVTSGPRGTLRAGPIGTTAALPSLEDIAARNRGQETQPVALWCAQCDRMVRPSEAAACDSRFCNAGAERFAA